jgi:hypothetical protein
MPSVPPTIATGHAVYTPLVLALYDAWVLGISNSWIWKCPTGRLLEHYNQHVTDHHLDVGVGTGYYLDKCRFPSVSPQLTLLDLNPHSLRAASRRIARYRPTTVQANVLEPLPLDDANFRSIGLMYVLHCLPGTLAEKLFGATIVQGVAPRSGAARWLMARYNRRGIFSNAHDDLPGLRAALEAHFDTVELEIVGCVAMFAAR